MVKYLAFWDCERRQKIWFDAASSKGIPEEVANELDVSLIQIDTYQYYGEITTLIGQTPDSGGGGMEDILAGELNFFCQIFVFYRIINCCLYDQS